MRPFLPVASAALIALAAACSVPSSEATAQESADKGGDAIAAAVAAPSRTPANTARDRYRHPAETLAFFGVKPGDTIVELWPGGGWYTEILAPLARTGSTLYAAAPAGGLKTIEAWRVGKPDLYGAVRLAEFPHQDGAKIPDGSADVVLTFRNVHNWRFKGADNTAEAFRQIYAMLKPGGTLGVVDHRLPEDMDSALEEKSGYMKRSSIVGFAEAAGFKLAGESDINANPKDTHDYPGGVWTLPPTLAKKDENREKYLATGESDRMTLKFVKPAS